MTYTITSPITEQAYGLRYPQFRPAPTAGDSERQYAIRLRNVQAIVSFPGDVPHWMDDVVNAFSRIMDLESNWDSYHAHIINEMAAVRALQFILRHANLGAPYIAPTPEGGVQVEWMTKAAELEVEFQGGGIVGGYFENLSDKSERELNPSDFRQSDLPIDIRRIFG